MKNKKMPGLAGRACSLRRRKQERCLIIFIVSQCNFIRNTHFSAERQQKLSELDAAMLADDQAGDFDGYVDSFLAWLDTFCSEAGHGG